jgi:hypothetical protein
MRRRYATSLLVIGTLVTLAGCGGEPTVPTDRRAESMWARISDGGRNTLNPLVPTEIQYATDPGFCDNGVILVVCCPGPPQVAREGYSEIQVVGANSDCIQAPPGISPGPLPMPPSAPPSPPISGGPPTTSPPIPLPPPNDGGNNGGGVPNWGGLGCQQANATAWLVGGASDPACPDPEGQYTPWIPGPSDADYLEVGQPISELAFPEIYAPEFDCTRVKCPRWDVVLYSAAVERANRELRELIRPGIDIDTEYGAFIFQRRDGVIYVGPYLRSQINGRFSYCDGAHPETLPKGAIGCIHTHYSDVNRPNTGDAQTAKDLGRYVLVSLPSALYIFDYYGQYRGRNPP